ncbi:MAG TPA: YoaK family protein [Burkholderiales bacterium]
MATAPASDPQRRLLPLLFVLTFNTGLVDAVSYLLLGHVFVANMTGNIILLGFSLVGVSDFSLAASVTALLMFGAGAVLGGHLGRNDSAPRRLLGRALLAEGLLFALAAAPLLHGLTPQDELVRYWLIVALGMAMGVQTAMVRLLAIPDLTTTVLTLTLAGLAADSSLAGGSNPRLGRRLGAVALMLAGAAVGALLALHASAVLVLLLALALLTGTGVAAWRGLDAGGAARN